MGVSEVWFLEKYPSDPFPDLQVEVLVLEPPVEPRSAGHAQLAGRVVVDVAIGGHVWRTWKI